MAECGHGPKTSKICILGMGQPHSATFSTGRAFPGSEWQIISSCLFQAGLSPESIRFEFSRDDPTHLLMQLPNLEVIVTVGKEALKYVTGYTSLEKYQLSPLNTLEHIKAPKCVPTFDCSRINKNYEKRIYMARAFMRAKEGSQYSGPWKRKRKVFHVEPDFSAAMNILHSIKDKEILAVDIETGAGIINTVGFAWNPHEAVAIKTLPEDYNETDYYNLWVAIADVLEGPSKKILQNNIYEAMYFSRYGIQMSNIYHDTMWAMKVLWPEFEMGLGNVGRFYTNEIYWKDDGKVETTKEKKDWDNVKDWTAHLTYNCSDTSGTFEAYENQKLDLEARGMDKFFYSAIMRRAEPIIEMCVRGLPTDVTRKEVLRNELETRIKILQNSMSEQINTNSPKQKLEFLKSKGYKIPLATGNRKGNKVKVESTNELSLKKLRLKHPDDQDIKILLELLHLSKALGSYVNFNIDPDNQLRFQMTGTGTETLRFSSSIDPWGNGLNAQTLPKKYKQLFIAPEGYTFLQADLAQAESRYVAYEACDETLMRMLEDPNEDIHSYVAAAIFGVPQEQVIAEKNSGNPSKRQLGKKSGHGANYDMGANTFMESCLKEMDLVLSRAEAEKVLTTYHSLFPGIRQRQNNIIRQLKMNSYLENPFGFRRYFYGRLYANSTHKEAFAFAPQSTIPEITNRLMFYLCDLRREGKLDFSLHLQVHDSLVLLVPTHKLQPIIEVCLNTNLWHPEVVLPAGKLVIPTSIEIGSNLKQMEEI